MQNNKITLSKTEKGDLNMFFQFQLDEEANYLAAFTAKDGFANARQAEIEEYIYKLSE